MIKNIQKILITGTILILVNNPIYSQNVTYTPQNSVIAIDLHDVITQFSPKKAYTGFKKLRNKGNFIGNVCKYLFTSKRKRKCIESYALANISDKQQALALLNPHVPNQAMIKIIEALKALGYQIYLCSNIGEQSYEYMQNLYPDVFGLFDGCYVSSASTGYIKKNDPQFFLNAAKLIDEHAGIAGITVANIIYIDNERDNLKLAQATDPRFVGLFFKNIRQISKKLHKLGLQ